MPYPMGMARYATTTLVAAIKTQLDIYIAAIVGNTDAQTDYLKAQANYWEGVYLDALNAYANANASAASNYANGVGMSVTKRDVENAMALAEKAYNKLYDILLAGGQTLPSFGDESISLWSMSGIQR